MNLNILRSTVDEALVNAVIHRDYGSYHSDASELARAERLRQSILKQAFSGKLVPQDPDHEPASVLLEKIRDEKEHQQPKQRKKA